MEFALTPPLIVFLILTGVVVGVFSGLLGIGGGILVIPMLMLLFHFTHKQAIGTSLGMLLPPIGVFAFMAYWRHGYADVRVAGLLAMGFAGGAFVGGWLAARGIIPENWLRRAFALFLIWFAWDLLFHRDRRAWPVLQTVAAALAAPLGALAAWAGLRALGRRWERRASLPRQYLERLEKPVALDYEI